MWGWAVEADLHHFSRPHLLSERDQRSRVPDYWIALRALGCTCLFSSPPKWMPVTQGSTVSTQIREALLTSKHLRTAFLKKYIYLHNNGQQDKTPGTPIPYKHVCKTFKTPLVQRDIPNSRGMQIHTPPCHAPSCVLSPHARQRLLDGALLRPTSGQPQQQPCPAPRSAPARHRSPDHSSHSLRRSWKCQQPSVPNTSWAN